MPATRLLSSLIFLPWSWFCDICYLGGCILVSPTLPPLGGPGCRAGHGTLRPEPAWFVEWVLWDAADAGCCSPRNHGLQITKREAPMAWRGGGGPQPEPDPQIIRPEHRSGMAGLANASGAQPPSSTAVRRPPGAGRLRQCCRGPWNSRPASFSPARNGTPARLESQSGFAGLRDDVAPPSSDNSTPPQVQTCDMLGMRGLINDGEIKLVF